MSALWEAGELRAATEGMLRVPFAAGGVSIDSRTLKPGDLFVALVGENGDGHAHVAAAFAAGAAGAMVHRLPDGVGDGARLLLVGDTLEALRGLAAFARARFSGRLVAVTGSVGKTTTKEMLRTMLVAQGHTWAAEASHNNQWGVPLTLARLSRRAAYCVVEIGMNHAGEISPLARLSRPHVGVITNIERSHVGHLGSVEAIADEKATLLDGLEPGGIAVLPADSPYLDRLRARAGAVRLFGAAAGADARLDGLAADAEGSDVSATLHGRALTFRLGAPGRHMAINALAALLAAEALGADVDRAAAALAGFSAVAGRGARRHIAVAGGAALLLDESYNASTASVRAALAVLALQPASRRIAVLGDMLELGESGPAEHVGLAADIAANADLLFACGPLMQGAFAAIPPRQRGAHAPDSAALAPIVAGAVRPGDAILVKGSLGSRMRRIVAALEATTDSRGTAA
ncbi:MAG: UDP-N-acetylmuramoyl-tripeptide--D-alanyl-D-alanine ligase [Rhodospirillales bacterium]|nr:UDP-N-acetylmuramoyl-tripeptide--D-alanyl-D-alanine ligase [Rhodospirillales bacterium]